MNNYCREYNEGRPLCSVQCKECESRSEITPLRETIGYILTHNIIYSTQYELIEYGKAGEQLEKLLASEMGKFAEWLDNNKWFIYMKYQWMKADTEETATTEELVHKYLNRNNTPQNNG